MLGASYIQVRGIDFMRAANDTQRAAVDFCKGTNNLIEDCSISHAAMGGLNFWFQHYSVARRCIMNSNGQQGVCGYYSVGSLYEDCETSYNNRIPWKKVDIEYQCGGFKMLYNYKVRFIRHQAHQNIGPGLWFDMSNEETEVANCFASGNMIGTFNEISFKIHIHDSVFIKNKGAGVGIAESPGATIERNIFYDNDEGLIGIEQQPFIGLWCVSAELAVVAEVHPHGAHGEAGAGDFAVEAKGNAFVRLQAQGEGLAHDGSP